MPETFVRSANPRGHGIAEEDCESEDVMTLQPYAIAKETANDLPANARPANAQPPNDRPRRRTILLVEDEPFVREATCNILRHAGFEVLCAEDAQKATQIYEECNRAIDLVMTDMVLPGRSGQQLGEDLRKHSPEVAVLVTSGYGNAEYELEAPESHTYFLAKPYSRRTLLDKIEKILAKVSLAQAAGKAV
jgi:FixJ family two-component response regulator